jgi:hypothetical protein
MALACDMGVAGDALRVGGGMGLRGALVGLAMRTGLEAAWAVLLTGWTATVLQALESKPSSTMLLMILLQCALLIFTRRTSLCSDFQNSSVPKYPCGDILTEKRSPRRRKYDSICRNQGKRKDGWYDSRRGEAL